MQMFDKCKYSGYGIGFDRYGIFSFPTGGFGCNVILDMGSVHVDNKKKDVLILGEGQGLDDTTLTAEKVFNLCYCEQKEILFKLAL